MLKLLDVIKLSYIVVFSIAMLLIYFLEIDVNITVKNILILITHTSAIPVVYIVWDTQWVSWTILVGVVMSIISHTSIIFDWNKEHLQPLDISFANLTLMLVTILIMFEKVPLWTIPVVVTLSIIIAVFYDQFWLYLVTSGLFSAANLIYIIYRIIEPSEKRDKWFLGISLVVGICGMIAFMVHNEHTDKYYQIFHSIWHVCCYGSLYFSLRSIRGKGVDEYRRPRLEFTKNYELGTLAYK